MISNSNNCCTRESSLTRSLWFIGQPIRTLILHISSLKVPLKPSNLERVKMSNRFAKFYIIPIVAVALMAIQPAHAQSTPAAEPVALSNLQTMVNNLGYTTTLSPDKQHFYFQWQSPKYNYQIDMVLSTN